MSLSFRKSFKLAPGVNFNVGRRGVGLSAGPRGAKVSANTRRQRRGTLSLFGFRWGRKL